MPRSVYDSTTVAGGSIVAIMLRIVRRFAGWILVALLVPVVGQFPIQWATEQGIYDDASGKVARFMTTVAEITSQQWFAFAVLLWAGFTIGVWLVGKLRKAEAKTVVTPSPIEQNPTSKEIGLLCIKMSRGINRDMGREFDHRKLFYRKRPELTSLALYLSNRAIPFEFQALNYKEDFRWLLQFFSDYLAALGPLLRDGHLPHAEQTARAYFEQTWPARPITEAPPLQSLEDTGQEIPP